MDYCSECAKCVFDKKEKVHRCKQRRHEILMPERYLACGDFEPENKLMEEKEKEKENELP